MMPQLLPPPLRLYTTMPAAKQLNHERCTRQYANWHSSLGHPSRCLKRNKTELHDAKHPRTIHRLRKSTPRRGAQLWAKQHIFLHIFESCAHLKLSPARCSSSATKRARKLNRQRTKLHTHAGTCRTWSCAGSTPALSRAAGRHETAEPCPPLGLTKRVCSQVSDTTSKKAFARVTYSRTRRVCNRSGRREFWE